MKSVSFYLEQLQRYGVLKNVQLSSPPCIKNYVTSSKNDLLCVYFVALSLIFNFYISLWMFTVLS